MREKRDRIGLKWKIFIGAIAAVFAVGLWWHHYINRQYIPNVPNPRMPSPNAYDYYTRAANSIVDSHLIEWAIRDTPSSKPKPPKALVPTNPLPPPGIAKPEGPPAPHTIATIYEQETILQKNAKCLATLRSGFNYVCRHPPVRTLQDAAETQPQFVELSDLLILESKVYQHHSDWPNAMGSLVDGVRLGSNIVRGSWLLNSESEGIQRRSVRLAWYLVDKLDAGSSRTLAQEMDSIINGARSYADILREKKHSSLSIYCNYYERPDWQFNIAKSYGFLDGQNHSREVIRSYTTSRYTIFDTYSKAIDRIIIDTQKPYAENLSAPPVAKEFFYYWLLGRYSDGMINTLGRFEWERTTATTRLLTLSLALRAYYIDHGSYPASLKALVPDYLSKLPKDPFALKGTFKYKSSGSSYILYSLGPDCKDDGGKAIGKSGHRGVKMSSKGDIVAGVNY